MNEQKREEGSHTSFQKRQGPFPKGVGLRWTLLGAASTALPTLAYVLLVHFSSPRTGFGFAAYLTSMGGLVEFAIVGDNPSQNHVLALVSAVFLNGLFGAACGALAAWAHPSLRGAPRDDPAIAPARESGIGAGAGTMPAGRRCQFRLRTIFWLTAICCFIAATWPIGRLVLVFIWYCVSVFPIFLGLWAFLAMIVLSVLSLDAKGLRRRSRERKR
jgi:hypothetical protein